MDEKTMLKRYAELKIQEKALKAEIDDLNPQIKEFLSAQGVEKLPTSAGTFTLKPVSVWKFSKFVETALKGVEKLKEEEKAKGIATSDVRYDLVFTALKTE